MRLKFTKLCLELLSRIYSNFSQSALVHFSSLLQSQDQCLSSRLPVCTQALYQPTKFSSSTSHLSTLPRSHHGPPSAPLDLPNNILGRRRPILRHVPQVDASRIGASAAVAEVVARLAVADRLRCDGLTSRGVEAGEVLFRPTSGGKILAGCERGVIKKINDKTGNGTGWGGGGAWLLTLTFVAFPRSQLRSFTHVGSPNSTMAETAPATELAYAGVGSKPADDRPQRKSATTCAPCE